MAVQLNADIELPLVRGAEPQKLTFVRIVHFIYLVLPRLREFMTVLPFMLLDSG
jgi:hypothetical protein